MYPSEVVLESDLGVLPEISLAVLPTIPSDIYWRGSSIIPLEPISPVSVGIFTGNLSRNYSNLFFLLLFF